MKTEIDRVFKLQEKDADDAQDKIEELNLELKQIEVSKLEFRHEMELTEKELKGKLRDIEHHSRQF